MMKAKCFKCGKECETKIGIGFCSERCFNKTSLSEIKLRGIVKDE